MAERPAPRGGRVTPPSPQLAARALALAAHRDGFDWAFEWRPDGLHVFGQARARDRWGNSATKMFAQLPGKRREPRHLASGDALELLTRYLELRGTPPEQVPARIAALVAEVGP